MKFTNLYLHHVFVFVHSIENERDGIKLKVENKVSHDIVDMHPQLGMRAAERAQKGVGLVEPTYPRARGEQRSIFTGAASPRRRESNAFILYTETSRSLRVASGRARVVEEGCFGFPMFRHRFC
jgi:hypothetical protein